MLRGFLYPMINYNLDVFQNLLRYVSHLEYYKAIRVRVTTG